MKAAIFDPYLDTLGGGERYVMTLASILEKNGWEVDVEWNDQKIITKLKERFGLNLSGVNVTPSINKGKGYDLCFWLSDGSIPNLSADRNILHFQVPFHDVRGRSIANRLKLIKISRIVCNSQFTKQFVDREYGVKSLVIYPPVDVKQFRSSKKENIILSVGRFSQLLQAKRQDVLIDAFKKMRNEGLVGWKLILAGGTDVGGKEFVKSLKLKATGFPIEIIENPDFNQLKKLYGKVKIFWSASGYEIDEEKEPEKVEHFGITVVEAMAAGCVPLVCDKGGHCEIVENGTSGFLWKSLSELISSTKSLTGDGKKIETIAANAKKEAKRFSLKRFEDEIKSLVI